MPSEPVPSERLVHRADLLLLVGLTLATSVLLNTGVVCSNDGANYALIRAFGDGGVQIDAYRDYTYGIDYSMRDGHYYSPRAPGTAFFVLPCYVVAHLFTQDDPTLQFASGLCPGLFLAALACLAYVVVRRLGYSRGAGIFTALALCLGTPLRSYGTGMWSHVLAAFFALALVALAHETITRDHTKERLARYCVGLGVLAAMVVSVDYSAAVYATLVLVIVVVEGARRTSVRETALRCVPATIAGGLVGMVPTLAYHQVAFGSPFRTGYDYVVGQYEIVHHLSGMYGGSFFDGFFGLLGHPRAGLFLWSPVLITGMIALPAFLRRLGSRANVALFTVPAIAMFLVASRYTWWDGGGVHDVRFITQSLPLIALPVAAAADACITNGGPRRPAAALGFSALFVTALVLQAIKHHAYWARDGSVWIARFRDAGENVGPVVVRFAAWCWPHPIAAVAIVIVSLGLAIASVRADRASAV